jgi:hypothetical protein
MFVSVFTILPLLPLVFATPHYPRDGQQCIVKSLGGGQDDGPNINAAFKNCAAGGTVVLHEHYVVDTLLMTTGLKNVNIELSGVGTFASGDSWSTTRADQLFALQFNTPPTSQNGRPSRTILRTRMRTPLMCIH